jgi:hypothetical protein
MSKTLEYVKKPVGRPKKHQEEKTFDKKTYMKEYMKEYNSKNKIEHYNRRNTSYYVKKFNIDNDFINKYGIYTASVYKCKEDLKKIKSDCPTFLKDMKDFIKELIKELD